MGLDLSEPERLKPSAVWYLSHGFAGDLTSGDGATEPARSPASGSTAGTESTPLAPAGRGSSMRVAVPRTMVSTARMPPPKTKQIPGTVPPLGNAGERGSVRYSPLPLKVTQGPMHCSRRAAKTRTEIQNPYVWVSASRHGVDYCYLLYSILLTLMVFLPSASLTTPVTLPSRTVLHIAMSCLRAVSSANR